MRLVLTGVAALTALLVLAGVMAGGFYLRSLHRPVATGQARASLSPSDSPVSSPTPTDLPSPSPTQVPSAITPAPTTMPAVSPNPAPRPPSCSPQVITSFKATAAPRSVILSWTISGGCNNEPGYIQGSFGTESTGMTMYPGYWVIQFQRPERTVTDRPVKPATAGQVCLFDLTYYMVLDGIGPNGRAPAQVTAEVYGVNLC